jgi:transcriptional regulator with XRE-family HTH domain
MGAARSRIGDGPGSTPDVLPESVLGHPVRGDETVPDVGSVVKNLRKQHGMSLGQLAKESGLSTSFLSEVERGQSDISVRRLARLAAVFGHDLGSLLGYSARRTAPQVIAGGNRIEVDRGDGITYVAFRIPGTGLELFAATLAPHSSFQTPLTHAGFDVCYVAEGEIGLEFDGQEYRYAHGECATWPGSYPHLVRNPGDVPAVIVAITTEVIY